MEVSYFDATDVDCGDYLVLSEINIDSLKVWKAHPEVLAEKLATDSHATNEERCHEHDNTDDVSDNEELNESMDFIPPTAILQRVSSHLQGNGDVACPGSDGIQGDDSLSDKSPMVRRSMYHKRDSTNKQGRFPSYLRSRGKLPRDCLENPSPLAKLEQDIHRKIDVLGKRLNDQRSQSPESEAHHWQMLVAISSQLTVCENLGESVSGISIELTRMF